MTNEETITILTEIWYACLIDHHKDKDCHWYIDKTWSYGQKPIYSVQHYGYIIDDFKCEDFNTMEDAETFLIQKLKYHINKEIDNWLRYKNEEQIPKEEEDKIEKHFLELRDKVKEACNEQFNY